MTFLSCLLPLDIHIDYWSCSSRSPLKNGCATYSIVALFDVASCHFMVCTFLVVLIIAPDSATVCGLNALLFICYTI